MLEVTQKGNSEFLAALTTQYHIDLLGRVLGCGTDIVAFLKLVLAMFDVPSAQFRATRGVRSRRQGGNEKKAFHWLKPPFYSEVGCTRDR